MSERGRIGLRDVRALGPGDVIWDAGVPGFGARRQKGAAIAYILKYRTAAPALAYDRPARRALDTRRRTGEGAGAAW